VYTRSRVYCSHNNQDCVERDEHGLILTVTYCMNAHFNKLDAALIDS